MKKIWDFIVKESKSAWEKTCLKCKKMNDDRGLFDIPKFVYTMILLGIVTGIIVAIVAIVLLLKENSMVI